MYVATSEFLSLFFVKQGRVKKHRNSKIHNFVILKTKNHFDQIISKMHMFLFKEKLLNKLHIGFKYVFILVFSFEFQSNLSVSTKSQLPSELYQKGMLR